MAIELGLIWFGNDLRKSDQNAVAEHAQEVRPSLVCLYCDELT